MEQALQKLKNLADESGSGWRYAPLHVFLNEAAARPAAISPRIPLKLI
jgi:hypothetical protein